MGKREGKRSFEFFFSFSRSPRVLSLYPCVASRRAIFDPFPSEFRSPLLTGAFPTPCLPLDRGNQSRSEPSGGEKQGAATARSRIVVAADRGVIARGLGERSWSGGTPGATRRRRRRRRSARGLCFHWEMRVRRGGEEGGSSRRNVKENSNSFSWDPNSGGGATNTTTTTKKYDKNKYLVRTCSICWGVFCLSGAQCSVKCCGSKNIEFGSGSTVMLSV